MTPAPSADTTASLLIAAPEAERGTLWEQARALPTRDLAWALKRCCDTAWNIDPPATLLAAQWIERLAAEQPQPEVEALAAWTRGIALLTQSRMDEALAALQRAGEGFDAQGLPHEAAHTSISRMMALAMLSRFDEAVRCGSDARAVFDAAGDSLAAGKIELNLGNLAARRDRHDDAVPHYEEARTRFVAAGEAELEMMAIKGLADMMARQHEFEAADALYRQAHLGAASGGFALLTGLIDRDLGGLEMRRGRYDRALLLLERSRAQFAKLEVPHRLAVAEESQADAYLELNLLPEALALYERSLATYETAGLATDRAWALAQRGRALTLLGRHEAAAASLTQAQAAFTEEDNAIGAALVQLLLAELARQRRDWRGAAHHAVAAEAPLLEARQMSWHLHARCLFAEALRGAGDVDEAETVARAACASADALSLAPAQRRSRLLLGLLARDRGDATEARRCFEAVVASIESQRGTLPGEEFRSAFLGDNLLAYHELVRCSLADDGPHAAEAALQWVERARARSLADAIDNAGQERGVDDDAARERARLRLELNDRYRALARPFAEGGDAQRLLDDVRRLEQRLLEAGRRDALGSEISPLRPTLSLSGGLDMAALHDALGEHTALIEYFSIDNALLACVVAGGEIDVVRLPAPADEVRAAIEQLRFQTDSLRHGAARLAHRLPELQRRALHHLQRLHVGLWAPLARRLGGRRAVVVPHGALHYLPFEALHDGQQHEIERRELVRAPSAAMLLRGLQQARPRFDTALVLGHADERLPHVRAEVEAVAAAFPGALLLHADAAHSDALRAACGDADVLHIACHAQFRNDSPRFSALHLADGAFTVRDAQRLQLGGGLVTLSACETGMSAVMPGDELIGLTQAFLSAGAARVLASLWTVQDETAAAFMRRFYERLRGCGQPAQALRATQIETLARHPHPYFWSAFTLHGGW